MKRVRFIARNKGAIVDIIEVPENGIYTYYGQYRVVVQRHIDAWLVAGYSVTRKDIE